MTIALVLALFLAPASAGHPPAATPVSLVSQNAIFLVRHAEKAKVKHDPPLSKEGAARAQRLADLLQDAGVTSILTTELQRTKQTAAPLAKKLKVDPVELSSADPKAFAARALQGSGATLVVGHSNTLPDILAALGVKPAIAIADDEYSNLFVVVPAAGKGGEPVLIRLRF